MTHYTGDTDPSTTVSANGTAQHFAAGAAVEREWWALFKSPKLDSIVAESLAKNPGLEAAEENLRQAQDNLRAGYGVFFPQVGADYSATRTKFSPLKFGEGGPATLFNIFSLSGTVSYVLDIFGGERRAVEALGAEAGVQDAEERATYLTLVGNIADTVIARAAYAEEIVATKELIVLEKQQLALAQVQFQAGTASYSGVLSIESQLHSYEAALPGLEQRANQADDLLAALAGHTPAEWTVPHVSLSDLTLPEELPVSLPSQLVRQRPDVLAAQETAHAASADIGVATAAMLPSVTINAGYSANSKTMSTLFGSSGSAWSLEGDVAAPVFEGGTLWFKRKAAIDSYKASMALYRQTVLGAFEQVADTLRALDHDAQALAAQQEALRTAKTALQLAETNNQAGLNTYLDVINADVQYRQALITEIGAVAVRYQDTVALFVALGGGWWNKQTASLGTSS